ncbi:Vacuolar protein sorting-associated protein 52 [Kluyveromyces marxianus]
MDALCDILGFKEASPPNGEESLNNKTEDDVYESYVKSSSNKEYYLHPGLLKELDDLVSKEEKLRTSTEVLIPNLKTYFVDFHNNLNALTKDLDFVKGKSSELSSLLKSNSSRLKDISPIVNDLIISPEVIDQVLRGKIDHKWLDCIDYLNDKQEIYHKYLEETDKEKPQDFDHLNEVLQILKAVCVERSKKFIVIRIKRLRDGHPVPAQRIQEELLQVKEIYQMIYKTKPELALGLREAYLNTMKWYYKTYFSRYIRSLTILQYVQIDSNFGLGHGLSNTSVSGSYANYLFSGGRSLFASQVTYRNDITDDTINDYFQISKRLDLITQEDKTVMVSQIAENNPVANYLEVGFKNLNLAILDNCTAEFLFLNEFFRLPTDEGDGIRKLLLEVFQPTFDNALEFTHHLIDNTYDIFGVLISIRVAHRLQFEAQSRQTPCIDDYLDGQLILLWPKFQKLVDFQCEQLRSVAITTNTAHIRGSENHLDPLVTPHELTVQFSKFLLSLLKLSLTHKELLDERSEPLFHSINRIRDDFETIMTKCSKKSKNAEKFLTTNYMYLYNSLQQSFLKSDSEREPLILSETKVHLSQLIEAYSK